jgi:cytochrome c556
MRRTLIGTVAIIATVLGASVSVAAGPDPADAVKYRQSIMKAMSGHAGAISLLVRGRAGDPHNAAEHAQALVSLGAEVESIFQEGSIVEDSEALPAIWENPEEFQKVLATFAAAIAALGDVADSGEMQVIDAAFREVGQACRGCHENFRMKD